MQILITARHTDVPDALRARTEEMLEKLGRLAHRAVRAEAIFDAAHQQHVVELHMQLPRSQLLVAKGEAPEFRTALDRAVEKLRVQIEKETGRMQDQVKAG